MIMVYIKDDANQAAIDTMGQEIKALGNVKELEYVPKEKAWAQQLETMEDAQAKFFTQISSDIPLPNAYKVTVADLGKFDQTVKGLKGAAKCRHHSREQGPGAKAWCPFGRALR